MNSLIGIGLIGLIVFSFGCISTGQLESDTFYSSEKEFCENQGMVFDVSQNRKTVDCILVDGDNVIKRCEITFIDHKPTYLDLTQCKEAV